MITFLFSVMTKQYFWDKVYDLLQQKYDEFEVVFVTSQQNGEYADIKALSENKSNVKLVICDQFATENQMIQLGIKAASGDSLVLCRDYFDFTTILADFLIQMGQQGGQIVMYKKQKKQNKFCAWISKIYHKCVQKVFNFDTFEGDIGLIYFNEIAFSVLKQLPNCAIMTKVNRWRGFDICYATIEDLKKPNPQKFQAKKQGLKVAIAGGVLAVLIAAMSVLLAYNLIGFVLVLFFAMFIIFDFLWLVYGIFRLSILYKVGDLK